MDLPTLPPPDVCDRARAARDARFDGLFFNAVRSTGFYCRRVCPAPTPNSQNIALTTDSQSKTTAKAGNFSLDFTYRLTSMYSAGVFARYAGGELDLPAVRKLKVGTAQAGGLIRYRF